jgi:hypothetical protein
MNILELFKSKNESSSKQLGSFECGSNELVTAFRQLASMTGLVNPAVIQYASSKGISISKKNDVYRIKLLMFTPPLELEWTDLTPLENLFQTLDQIAEKDNVSHIGSMTFTQLDSGKTFFQLALSN